MKFLLVFFSFIIAEQSFCQDQAFSSIEDVIIDFDKMNKDNLPEVMKNFDLFRGKDFDSTDVMLLKEGPLLGIILVKLTEDSEKITYGRIYNELSSFKTTYLYSKVRNNFLLEIKTVDLSDWNTDSLSMINSGWKTSEITEFHKYIGRNYIENENYKSAEKRFRDSKVNPNVILLRKAASGDEGYNLPEFLKRAESSNKPLIIYFSGYACVNARKMEERVLAKESVFSILSNDVIFITLNVDSGKELNGKDKIYSPKLKRSLKTIGDVNMLAQMEYGSTAQPYFITLSSKGKLLAAADVYFDEKAFSNFLLESINANK